MNRTGWSAAVLFLTALPCATAAASPASLPPTRTEPPIVLDRSVFTGISPEEAARRAIGASASEFSDHVWVPRQIFMPTTEEGVIFYRKPQVVRPGLCAADHLGVLLKRTAGEPDQYALDRKNDHTHDAWQATDSWWGTTYRHIRVLDGSQSANPQIAIPPGEPCAELTPAYAFFFPNYPGMIGGASDVFEAPSDDTAWRALTSLQRAIGWANGRIRTHIELVCDDESGEGRKCGKPKKALAELDLDALRQASECMKDAPDPTCVQIDLPMGTGN
jgi:hypothetical protein